jgi:hypothetical protein
MGMHIINEVCSFHRHLLFSASFRTEGFYRDMNVLLSAEVSLGATKKWIVPVVKGVSV